MYTKYSEVPVFRKNWFVILSWFIFWPGCLAILWTGDVYYEKDGVVATYGKSAKIIMTVIALLITLNAFGAFD